MIYLNLRGHCQCHALLFVAAGNLLFSGRTADAQYHTYIYTVDYRRGTTLADKRQRLAGYWCQPHCHEHIEQCLRDEQQGYAHSEQRRK